MIDALLIYPKLGSMDSLVVDPPLSIIYAAAQAAKEGRDLRLYDVRTEKGDWRQTLASVLEQGVTLAGVSVMTGSPLKNAREISRFIKERSPSTKLVWGGPHATVLPETLAEPYLDFLIRGFGSTALAELIASLKGQGPDLADIGGLSFKAGGRLVHNPRSPLHEMLDYRDLPYHLLDLNSPGYQRSYLGQRMFPMFTSVGCPYRCSFCVHPTIYEAINGKKWRPYAEGDVVEHMRFLIDRYGATHICLLDDTCFPDLERMARIFELIIAHGLRVTLEIRGARINEIDRMTPEFIALMVRAGGRIIMVGVESASDRVLKTMQKGITKGQILRVNRKLSAFPQLTPHYNFIYGTPGETYADLMETKDVILQLVRENPNAYIGFGGDWKPIPGSRMLTTAEQEYSFRAPATLDEWINMDSSDSDRKIAHPWYTRRHNNLIKTLQIASFVINDGLVRETADNRSALFRILRAMARLYKPVALFRLRANAYALPLEHDLWRLMIRLLPRLVG